MPVGIVFFNFLFRITQTVLDKKTGYESRENNTVIDMIPYGFLSIILNLQQISASEKLQTVSLINMNGYIHPVNDSGF